MYKTIVFIVLFNLLSLSSKSQELDIGPKLGANFATLGDLQQLDNEIGFVGGGFFTIKFEKFAIQLELLYSQEDEEFNFSGFDLDYVNLPLIFKFYLSGCLNFQLGPQFGVLVNDNIPDGILDSLKAETYDLSGLAGIGIDLPLKISLSARYIFDVQNDFSSADFNNGFLCLALGVAIF